MSAPELPASPPRGDDEPAAEQETARPSVTITRNAKGAAQWTVKVYGVDSSEPAAIAASTVAQRIYDDLTIRYGSGS